MATKTKDEILESISSMSVMDLVELIDAIEEKFGVTAAAVAAAPAAGAVPAGDAGLLHLHALCLRFHTCARVHTHATCARWLENSPLTIACRASPVPGRCVHACLARLLMSSLSCIPAFSPNVVCVQDSIFCAILHVINLYKWCKN